MTKINISMIELFSGIGAQIQALENTQQYHLTSFATSDIDKDAILSYAAVHNNLNNSLSTPTPSRKDIINELSSKQIGYDFLKSKEYNWSRFLNSKDPILEKHWIASHLSHNLGNIALIDKLDAFDLWTYSFPCTDISVAGKQEGIIKGKTRSGLLYEVERLLKTSIDQGTQPKVLLLENVKNLTGKRYINEFMGWLDTLDSLGYNTYWKVVNASAFIPQNRERVFAVSIRKDVDDGSFEFTTPESMDLRLKDMLETHVDESYYLDDKKMETLIKGISEKEKARLIQVGILDMKGQDNIRRVYSPEGLCPTITTMGGGHREPKIEVLGNYSPSKHDASRVVDENGLAPTVKENHGTVTAVRTTNPKTICLNSKGGRGGVEGLQPSLGDRIYDKDGISTAITTCFLPNVLIQKPTNILIDDTQGFDGTRIYQGVAPTLRAGRSGLKTVTSNNELIVAMRGRYDCNNQVKQRLELQKSGLTNTLTSIQKDNLLLQSSRIRKLTPRECWRLMGFSDEAFDEAQKQCSKGQLYKQAGNSIVVDCLEMIFNNLAPILEKAG